MRIQYNATEQFTSADINDYVEPPLTYRVWRNRSAGWTPLAQALIEGEKIRAESDDPTQADDSLIELALGLIGLSLVSVADEDKTHMIGSAEKAKELQAAIAEASDEAYGQRYILNLANAIIDRQLAREERIIEDLKKSSTPLDAGVKTGPSNGKTVQPTPSPATK